MLCMCLDVVDVADLLLLYCVVYVVMLDINMHRPVARYRYYYFVQLIINDTWANSLEYE